MTAVPALPVPQKDFEFGNAGAPFFNGLMYSLTREIAHLGKFLTRCVRVAEFGADEFQRIDIQRGHEADDLHEFGTGVARTILLFGRIFVFQRRRSAKFADSCTGQ